MAFGLADEDIARIQKVFSANKHVESACIFGSRAMGNHKPGSDIDIVVTGDHLTYQDQLQLQSELEAIGMLYAIDLQRMNAITDTDVIEHIHRVGKQLYQR